MSREVTLEWIRGQCAEEGECWLWQAGCSGKRREGGVGRPVMRNAEGQTVPVRREVYRLTRGAVPPERVVGAACGHPLCVAPGCMRCWTHRQAKQAAAARGAYSSMAKIMKGAATRRARSHVTEDKVQAIRAAATSTLAHRATGVSLAHCKAIRAGRARVDFSNPFAGLGA